MPFFLRNAIGTLPLITQLQGIVKQCWYADDSAIGGDILSLKRWWDLLLLLGPRYGYFPNGAKSWLVVKEGVEDTAREVFVTLIFILLLMVIAIWLVL